MITPHRTAAAQTRRRKPVRVLAVAMLAAGFVAALLPGFHWSLGTATTAMTYLIGTATLITLGTVALYLAERTPRDSADQAGKNE